MGCLPGRVPGPAEARIDHNYSFGVEDPVEDHLVEGRYSPVEVHYNPVEVRCNIPEGGPGADRSCTVGRPGEVGSLVAGMFVFQNRGTYLKRYTRNLNRT